MWLVQVICCALVVQAVTSAGVKNDMTETIHNETYFVVRLDTKVGTCVSKFLNVIHPIFLFDANSIPDGGFSWDQSSDWQLNDLEVTSEIVKFSNKPGDTYLVTDGSSQFQFLDDQSFMEPYPFQASGKLHGAKGPQLNIHSANATLLFAGSKMWEGKRGVIMEIDHVNPQTAVKVTRLKDCEEISMRGEKKCEMLLLLNDTNYLLDGSDYVTVYLEKREKCNKTVGSCLLNYELRDRNSTLLGAWAIKRDFFSERRDFVFARSNNRAAVFITDNQISIKPIAGRVSKMLRKMLSQSYSGKLVVHVEWKDYFNSPDQVQLFVKSVATNRIVHASRQSKYFDGSYTKVEFDRLDAGDYELTLHDITRPIQKIHICSSELCAPLESKIPHQRVVGCHLNLGEMLLPNAELTLSDSNKSSWSEDDWTYVCAQLGILNSPVEIKLCSKHGCVVSTCPRQGTKKPNFKCP